MLAYQHRTLTQSPIENALALAEGLAHLLDRDAELHVVSHSRGGLIGELLARGMRKGAAPFTPDDLSFFEEDARAKDREALEKLSRVLVESRIRLTRFVRVACPARGTTLADRRLDRYFSVLVDLAGMIPGLKANPVYDGLTSLLAGVLKKRTDPNDLPGLEAMMPTSALVRMLNRPDVVTAADLHILGGDLSGVGLFGRLKTLVTDFYYRDDHDLVVNTPAMLGGIERAQPVRYWIDTGDKVTHFHYFSRTDTARRLVSALTGSSTDFRTLEGETVCGHVGRLCQARDACTTGRVCAARDHGFPVDSGWPADLDEHLGACERWSLAARGQRRTTSRQPDCSPTAMPTSAHTWRRLMKWCPSRTTGGDH